MRILLIEPDSAVAQSIELMLMSEGFNVYTTDLGEEGVELGKLYDYDCILLADAPDLTDCDMIKSLRLARIKSSIIVLSRSAQIDDIVFALGIGADDYMTKPFHKDELVARLHAVVRRSKGHASSSITTGRLTVNIDTRTATIDGERLPLTGKEYQVLELLALRKGVTLSKERFINHMYGGMDEPALKIVDVFMCKLRKKISERTEGDGIIETIWGQGYVLRDPRAVVTSAPLAPDALGFGVTQLTSHGVELDGRVYHAGAE
jgi:two-component system cell cycle response regulator CtrA